jgi:uncharacterized membrane protein
MKDENSALSFERIAFFSDAVFAIVITLLVLEIKVPHLKEVSEKEVAAELVHLVPKFLGFVCSFFIVGLMWFEHHRIFRFIDGFDGGLIWRNLVFLLFISFIPFPTALFSEYFWSKSAFMLYVAAFGLAGLAKLWVWSYAMNRSFLVEGMEKTDATAIKRRSLAVPLACVICVVLGAFLPGYLAFLGFPLIPVFANLLDPRKNNKIEAAE